MTRKSRKPIWAPNPPLHTTAAPRYVKLLVKRQKHDDVGAVATVYAALRPTIRFVEPTTAEQQARPGTWLGGMLTRKPPMLVRVALANKMARGIWAMMTRGEDYRGPEIGSAA